MCVLQVLWVFGLDKAFWREKVRRGLGHVWGNHLTVDFKWRWSWALLVCQKDQYQGVKLELIFGAVIKSSERDDTGRLGLLNKEAFEHYFFKHLVCRHCPWWVPGAWIRGHAENSQFAMLSSSGEEALNETVKLYLRLCVPICTSCWNKHLEVPQ